MITSDLLNPKESIFEWTNLAISTNNADIKYFSPLNVTK